VPFAAALSEHPLPTHAVGEAIGQVLDGVGEAPDLAVLFVTAAHAGVLEDMAATVRSTLRPGTLLGCTASSIVGNDREVEQQPGVSLWAGRIGTVDPLRLVLQRQEEGAAIVGWPTHPPTAARAVLLLADPFSFPTDAFLDGVHEQTPTRLPVVGGMASAARGPGGNRLVLDDAVVTDGAVGAFVGGVEVESVVSQGCRPIGEPFVVTRAETLGQGTRIYELGGRPALERLRDVVAGLPPDERMLAQEGLHLGLVIDEHRMEFGRGDFLIRNLVGGDADTGMLQVADTVEVGGTVQFQVRDAGSADEDLREMMAGRSAGGALLFTCNGRGMHLFGMPDHDAGVVADQLDGAPVAGMFCQGEIGPVGGRNFLHGFTASVALFRDPT
jgi:small ligand-binding sensory domain FIST